MTARLSLETFDRLRLLSRDGSATCVSLLQPVDARTLTPHKDAVVYKNLLRTAKQRLQAAGMDAEQAGVFLQPLRALAESGALWAERGAGLAAFSTGQPDETMFFPLSFGTHAVAFVGRRFYYKPLLNALHAETHFYVLVLSLNGARLIEFTNGLPRELPMPGVRKGARASMPSHSGLDAQRHARSFTRGGPTGGFTSHTHGAGDIDHNAKAGRYFKEVADAVQSALGAASAPLVLAGVAHDLALYRAHDRYAHTLAVALEGNRDARALDVLRDEAAALLAAQHDGGAQQALRLYRSVNNTPRVTRAPKDILRAAHDGRVQTLFVADELDRWGRFDPATYQVRMHSLPRAGDVSLLNLAAEFTLQHRGSVYVLPRSSVPRSSAMAAILRN